MKFLGFSKYFLLLMLLFEIATENNALSSSSPLHLLSISTNLQENHTKSPQFVIGEFVEELNNDENVDETHSDFNFISLSSCLSAFACHDESAIIFTKAYYSLKSPNQKINVLNCIFLI